MYTRWAPPVEATVPTLARISRTSSTLLCEAASSSMTSKELPSVMATQDGQRLQGSPSAPMSGQLRTLAMMRAVVVLPVPRGPANR